GRHLHLAAARRARAAQGRGCRAPGDEPRRRDRAVDAGGVARLAVAGVGPLAGLRAGTAAPQGPPRARLRAAADLRGGRYRPGAQRAEELPQAAAAFLPDPDQVPRREPSPLRTPSRARIRTERRPILPWRLR